MHTRSGSHIYHKMPLYPRRVYRYIYVYIHVCDYMSMEVFLCAFASLVVDTYLCMYVYVNMHVCRCKRAYIHTYIYVSNCVYCTLLAFLCFMSPCVGMGREKWTITWYSFNHVNTPQVCTIQKTEKVIYSGLLPKDWTLRGAFSPFFYLSIFYLNLRTFSF